MPAQHPTRSKLRRAAQYLRMSTEHQNYALHHQAVAIAAYAERHGLAVVRTYEDAGVSGLQLHNRPGLKTLLADVVSGDRDFDLVLAYDVSRWGRFQDADQGAHYEFLCRDAGVGVEYCAELFDNDGSVTASILKQLKRVMAAEYSRELAAKVSAAQWNHARLGHWVGGPPGYGLRRQVVRRDGTVGPQLEAGQQKWVKTDHVVLVRGPPEEIALVRRIYRLFLYAGMSRRTIARTLNAEGLPAANGTPWSPDKVHEVLSNEKYAGVVTFGRAGGALTVRKRPRDAWARTAAPFAPIISARQFADAQRHIARRIRLQDDDTMIDGLRALLAETGRLSRTLINDDERIPCAQTYQHRFGGLLEAYRRAGYHADGRATAASMRTGVRYRRRQPGQPAPTPDDMIALARALYHATGRLSMRIIDDAEGLPASRIYAQVFGSMGVVYEKVGFTPTNKQRQAIGRGTRSRAGHDRAPGPRRAASPAQTNPL